MQETIATHAPLQGGTSDQPKAGGTCRLFDLEPDLDIPIPNEEELSSAFGRLQKIFEGKSTLKISAEIQEKVHTLYEDINCGLLYGILTDPASATKYLNLLRMAVKDHFNLISEKLLGLASSYSFKKFGKIPRKQIIWILEALCENSVLPFQKTFMFLIRQVKVCDLSSSALGIAAGVVRILYKHREKLPSQSLELFQVAVYSFLRMIPEHMTIPQLCRNEIEFVLYALYKNFSECIPIGRDLIRALQDVSAIPEFTMFWRKLLYEPQLLSKNFSGLHELTATPTPRWIICSRLTPQMEARLGWIFTSVPKPLDASFLSRYATKFLKTSSHELVYVDLMRFICATVHPTNEIIKSNVVQRWDAILYLLKTIKSEKVAQQVKLSLLYDFIFWNPSVDNIMNIEPSVLLIEKAMKFPNDANMHISTSLIEFLYLTVEHYSQDLYTRMNLSINLAMRELISKGVLRSIKQIYSPKLNRRTRSQLEALFPQFISNEDTLPSMAAIVDSFNPSQAKNRPPIPAAMEIAPAEIHFPEKKVQQEDIHDTAQLRKTAMIALDESAPGKLDTSRVELIKTIDGIKELQKDPTKLVCSTALVYNMFSSLNEASTFDLDRKFNDVVSSFDVFLPRVDEILDGRGRWALSPLVCFLEVSSEKYCSLSTPEDFMWSLYTNVFFKPEKDIYSVTLYLWVLRHCIWNRTSEPPEIFVQAIRKVNTQLSAFLYGCIEIIQRDDIDLFFAVVEMSYSTLPQEVTGNMELVTLMLQVMDPKILLSISKKLETGVWRIFGSNNTSAVIRYLYKAASELSEPEQTCIWRIFLSEFSERMEEASDLALRLLETGSVLSKSAEATFAFQQLLIGVTPNERHIKLLLISKHVDATFVLRKWIKKSDSPDHIMNLTLNAVRDLESDAAKEIIDPRLIPHIKEVLRQLRKLPRESESTTFLPI